MVHKRSRFVTTVAWLFIVASAPGAISLMLTPIGDPSFVDRLALAQLIYDFVAAATLVAAVGLLRRAGRSRRLFQVCAVLSACCVLSLPFVGSAAHTATLAEHGIQSDWFPGQTMALALAAAVAVAWVVWRLESPSVKAEFDVKTKENAL